MDGNKFPYSANSAATMLSQASRAMDRNEKTFACMKYTLILANLFCFILSIFNALFGIGYPDEKFPGGYSGSQMAMFSLVVMAFTIVGCFGAFYRNTYLLITYGCIILALSLGNLVLWFINNDIADMNLNGRVILVATVAFAFMFISFFLALHNKTVALGGATNPSRLLRLPSFLQEVNQRSQKCVTVAVPYPCPVPGCIAPCPVPDCTYGRVVTR